MNANTRRNQPEMPPRLAFAFGLLLGIALMLLSARGQAALISDRRARNEAILSDVLNEVVHD